MAALFHRFAKRKRPGKMPGRWHFSVGSGLASIADQTQQH
jgi:hypothetical protein